MRPTADRASASARPRTDATDAITHTCALAQGLQPGRTHGLRDAAETAVEIEIVHGAELYRFTIPYSAFTEPTIHNGTNHLSKTYVELGLCRAAKPMNISPGAGSRSMGVVVDQFGKRYRHSRRSLDALCQRNLQNNRVAILINKPVGYVSGQAKKVFQPAYVLVTAENRLAWRPEHPVQSTAMQEPDAGRAAGYRFGRAAGIDAGWPYRQT